MMLKALTCAFMALTACSAAEAASSDWFVTEGARIRLLTTGKPDDQGRLSGALQVELQPGWKTYWRDPGSSGVPPSVDVSKTPLLAGAEIKYPTPEWHEDAGGVWAGYDEPVVLPVEFTLRGSGKIGTLEADVFLGVCQTICVPVQAALKLDPDIDADNPADAALITAALAALPQPASDTFGAKLNKLDGDKAIFDVILPPDTKTFELFVAGENGYVFGPPKQLDGNLRAIHVIARPKTQPAGSGLAYTLVTPQGAVSGTIPWF